MNLVGWMQELKLIAFELAAKFSRRGENPVQPRLCNAKNAIFKRLKTGVSLRSRSSPANSNAISFNNTYGEEEVAEEGEELKKNKKQLV
jgi:hypothetical protein